MAKAVSATDRLQKLLEATAREHFPDHAVEEVRLEQDEDSDGDPILRIVLVMANEQAFDPVVASGFVRHLRPRLEGDLFPLVSFITSADNRKQHSAAG